MNVESIKKRLLVKYPFFGSVVANSNFIAEETIGTAETDGKNIYYNPNFIESITNDQQTFIFAHEICHIAFNHIFRSEGKDKKLWNIATDSVVNAFLKQDGLPIVEGVVDIPEAINYDAEEMYEKLLEKHGNNQNQKNNQQQSGNSKKQEQNQDKHEQSSDSGQTVDDQQQLQSQQSSSSGENSKRQDQQLQNQSSSELDKNSHEEEKQQNVGHDTHSMWDMAIEKKRQEEQQSQSDLGQSSENDEDKQSTLDKLSKMFDKKKEQKEQQHLDESQNKEQEKKINKEIKKLTELGEKEAFKQNKIERKKQLEELRKTLASQSYGHGNTTNSERRNITEIGTSEPLIDWRRLLKETVKYDIDWSYQNAEIEDGVVTAHLEEIPSPETEIVLDTSGSINRTLLKNFLRECKNILQTSKVKVGCFDTKFYGFTEIKDVSDIDNLPFYGGGGTNFEVAINAFTRRVENKIIFTDGDANMPSTPIDAIWIVFSNIEINPVGGKVIHVDGEQLKRLYNYQKTR